MENCKHFLTQLNVITHTTICQQCHKTQTITNEFFCKHCKSWQIVNKVLSPNDGIGDLIYVCNKCNKRTKNASTRKTILWN
jgi:predicted SprT family Zn-dependent metalloprotease